MDLVIGRKPFQAAQHREEIAPLLERIRAIEPRHVCEIGSRRGGNLFLFTRVAHAEARLLSIDIGLDPIRQQAHAKLGRARQSITCLRADSHAESTREAVARWLGSASLDFLFIDGDHNYAGVKQDFAVFSPFVRPGGLIAFHDIVPDERLRGHTPTGNWVGEVPVFWRELRASHPNSWEFIANPDQDGYGIGLIQIEGAEPRG